MVLAIVGFSGKTSATQQANELSARVEELTATVADLEAAAATAASDLEAKAGELETAKSDLEAAAAAKTEVDGASSATPRPVTRSLASRWRSLPRR